MSLEEVKSDNGTAFGMKNMSSMQKQSDETYGFRTSACISFEDDIELLLPEKEIQPKNAHVRNELLNCKRDLLKVLALHNGVDSYVERDVSNEVLYRCDNDFIVETLADVILKTQRNLNRQAKLEEMVKSRLGTIENDRKVVNFVNMVHFGICALSVGVVLCFKYVLHIV